MQPIQRAPCPDTPPSSAAYLAALIDGQARAGRVPANPPHDPGAAPNPADGQDGTALIWVEGAADGPGPAAGCSRGMIVATHGPGPAAAERTFIVSYPVEAGGQAQRIPAVLGLLRAKGWSLLASHRRKTASGRANMAVLINTAGPGGEQRLWLAEPVPASRTGRRARKPGLPHPLRAAAALPAARRQGRAWTESGAGRDPGA